MTYLNPGRTACWLLAVLCLFAGTLLAAAKVAAENMAAENHNRLTPEEAAAGWELLFDGQSLDRWRTYRKPAPGLPWQAIDGELTLTQRGGGDLITKDTWSNFELQLDWKISERGNSGIFILASESSEPIFIKAPEIQILDDARHPDNKLDTHLSGSLYDMIAAPAQSQKPAETWNRIVIRLEDGQLQVWQNDVMAVDVLIGGERWNELVAASKFAAWNGFGSNRSGHIGLQDHGDPVWFRNLKIRPLQEAR